MKTVLLSTSSLWNCGDDFIRDGLLELLQFKSDIRMLWWNRNRGVRNAYSNALKTNLPLIDYFVIAGTPEWTFKNERIYRHCLKKQIPIAIIGVGSWRSAMNVYHRALMKKVATSGLCEVVLARDRTSAALLSEVGFQNVQLTLDPAFFLPRNKQDNRSHILCWRSQFTYTYGASVDITLRSLHRALHLKLRQAVNKGMSRQKRAEYDRLMLRVFSMMPEPKRVMVHDNREVRDAERLFGPDRVFYSTDYREMLRSYATARRYVGSRIHGAVASIVNGASAHLVYTNEKAQMLEESRDILATHSEHVCKGIKVSYFGRDNIDPETFQRQSVDGNALSLAIDKEKERVRDILRKGPVLQEFTDLPSARNTGVPGGKNTTSREGS